MKAKWMIPFLVIYLLISCQSEPIGNPIPTSIRQQTATSTNTQRDKVILDYAPSPNGKNLAVYANSGIYIYDVDTMQKTILMEFEDNNYDSYKSVYSGAIAFSPNGKHLALSGKFLNTPITIWDIESKDLITIISELPIDHFISEIEFSPNNESILVRNMYTKADHCQGFLDEKVTLHNIQENEQIFEANKCSIYPPIRIQFLEDERLFLYFGSMSPTYSVQFVNSNTGRLISEDNYHFDEDGNFVGLSGDGKIQIIQRIGDGERKTFLLDSQTNEVIGTAEGEIVLFRNINSYVTRNFYYDREEYIKTQWEYWENGQRICEYPGLESSPIIKPSFNKEFFAMNGDYKEIQVWHVPTCEIVFSLPFLAD